MTSLGGRCKDKDFYMHEGDSSCSLAKSKNQNDMQDFHSI